MTDTTGGDGIERRRKGPEWTYGPNGEKRQLSKARWSIERVAEIFIDDPVKWFPVEKVAMMIYSTNTKKTRDNVRKHIPLQRTYMMSRLLPIITQYGVRGRIKSVKLFDRSIEADRILMLEELDRLRSRKELSSDRYEKLREIFGLMIR